MFPVLLTWPFSVNTYGVLLVIGILVSWFFLLRLAKHENINPVQIEYLLIWIIASGLLGARLLYIIVEWEMFLESPKDTLFSSAGLVFYGAFIAGTSVGIWRIKKMGLDLWKTLDVFAVTIPLMYIFGRIGCFANGCCYGRESHSWLGMMFHPDSLAGAAGVPVIPIQLFSAGMSLLLFLVLWRIYKNKKYDGEIVTGFFLLYGVTRFVIEIFRGDPRGSIGALSTSQVISIVLIICGIVLFARLKNKPKKTEKQ